MIVVLPELGMPISNKLILLCKGGFVVLLPMMGRRHSTPEKKNKQGNQFNKFNNNTKFYTLVNATMSYVAIASDISAVPNISSMSAIDTVSSSI